MCKVTDFGMARNANQDDIYTRKSRVRVQIRLRLKCSILTRSQRAEGIEQKFTESPA